MSWCTTFWDTVYIYIYIHDTHIDLGETLCRAECQPEGWLSADCKPDPCRQ